MNNENYITVIPVEYHRSTAVYPQPPHQYSDFAERIHTEGLNNVQHYNGNNPNIKVAQPPIDSVIIPDDDQFSAVKGLHACVYLMNNIVLNMALEDGANVTVSELIHAIVYKEELSLPSFASCVFTLWMSSNLLEVQLKLNHKPLMVRSKWDKLLSRFSHGSTYRQQLDEPILSFQRNVFYSIAEEQNITDGSVLELLYEEAKYNILDGRYPCEYSQGIALGCIQARLELGPYDPQSHTNNFFRTHKKRFLPYHFKHDSLTSWFRLRMKNSPEVKLLEQFKAITSSATDQKLYRKYLEICWSLPYYGSSFFQGQIEEPVTNLISLILQNDKPVLVGINERGVYIIDNLNSTLLLGLKYEDFSWEFRNPRVKNNLESLPCIFLQFTATENGIQVSKILQIFSKQAIMMDTLINTFVEQKLKVYGVDKTDNATTASGALRQNHMEFQATNLSKLNQLTLASFDKRGRLISQMGSLQFD